MVESILNFLNQTGFSMFSDGDNWKCLIMIAIAFVLSYLAIVKQFEPLLLLPIAFGMLLTNLPGAEMFHEQLFAGGHVNWDLFGGAHCISSAALIAPEGYQFQVLENGTVYLAGQYGNMIFGHLSGLALDAAATINSTGAVVSAAGEVLRENATIVIDMVEATVKGLKELYNE